MADMTVSNLNTPNAVRPVAGQTTVPAGVSGEQRGQELLSRMQNGQTVEGRVMSVTTSANGQRTALIDLGNQTTVSARLDSAMALTEGTNVTFQVRNGADGSISLNPLYQNTAMDSSALRALTAAGLDADTQSLQMVREMMSSGLSIDSENVLAMARAVQDYPQADMTRLLTLRAMELPVTENNLQQLSNYQNYQHQLVSSIGDLMNGLPQAFTTMTQTGQSVQALDMYGALMRMFTVPEEEVIDRPYLNATAAEAPAGVLGDVTSELPGSTAGQASLLNEEFMTAQQESSAVQRPSVGAAVEDLNPFAALSRGAQDVARENAAIVELQTGGEKMTPQAPVRLFAPDGTVVSRDAQTPLAQMQSDPLSNASFADLLKQAGIQANPDNLSATELMKLLSEQYRETAHTSAQVDAVWTKLFSAEEFNGLLKETMSNQWLLRPGDVADKGNIEDLYRRMGQQTKQLTGILEQTQGVPASLQAQAQQLSGNIDFMHQLNQMFQYVQLPLQMQNGDAHGDLYVYTNRRSLARDDGTVSAILHLDMDALGPLDVYLKMQENKVSTNFYVADDAVLDLIGEHIDELNARLEKRGYSMSCRLMLQSEMSGEDAAVDELLKVSPGSIGLVAEKSFDARA